MSSLACITDSLSIWRFSDQPHEITPLCSTSAEGETYSALCWNHTNQVVATANNSTRKIKLWQASNANLLSSIPFGTTEEFTDDIVGVTFSNTSRFIAAGIGSKSLVWDLKRRNLKCSFQHKSRVSAIKYHADTHIVSGDVSGMINVWDIKNNCNACHASPDNLGTSHSTRSTLAVECLQVNAKHPHQIVCGRANGSLQVYDIESCGMVRNMIIYGDHSLVSLSLSPKNSRLLTTVGADGRICLVDVNAGPSGGSTTGAQPLYQPSATIYVHNNTSTTNSTPLCVSCHDNGFHIAVGTSTGHLQVYDWRNSVLPVCEYELPRSAESKLGSNAIRGIAFQNSQSKPPAASSTSSVGSAAHSTSVSATSPAARTSMPPPSGTGAVVATAATSPPPAPAATTQLPLSRVKPHAVPPMPMPVPPPIHDGIRDRDRDAVDDGMSDVSAITYEEGSSSSMGHGSAQGQGAHRRLNHVNNRAEIAAATARSPPNDSSSNGAAPVSSTPPPVTTIQTPRTSALEELASAPLSDGDRRAVPLTDVDAEPSAASPQQARANALTSATDASSAAASASASASASAAIRAMSPAASPAVHGRLHFASPIAHQTSSGGGPAAVASPVPAPVALSPVRMEEDKSVSSSTPQNMSHMAAAVPLSSHSARMDTSSSSNLDATVASFREAHTIRPVSQDSLREALDELRYDIHQEFRAVLREQGRQFSIARDENMEMMADLQAKMNDLLSANDELRKENAELRYQLNKQKYSLE